MESGPEFSEAVKIPRRLWKWHKNTFEELLSQSMPRPTRATRNKSNTTQDAVSSIGKEEGDDVSVLSESDFGGNDEDAPNRRTSSNASSVSRRGQSHRAKASNVKEVLRNDNNGPGWWGRTVSAFRNRGQNGDDDASINSAKSSTNQVSRRGSKVNVNPLIPPTEPETPKETRFQEAERHAFSRWIVSIFEKEGSRKRREIATLARVEGPVFW